MSGIRRLAIMLVSWLVLPHAARADFQWVGRWQVDSQQGDVSFNAPTDLNIVALPSVFADASAVNNMSSAGRMTSSITFHRDYRVLNEPPGTSFDLTTIAILGGLYTKTFFGLDGSASFSIASEVSQVSAAASNSTTFFPLASNLIFSLNGSENRLPGSNGLHRITGSLFVDAHSTGTRPPSSDFISISVSSNSSRLTVLSESPPQVVLPADLNTPFPEPSSATLFGLGLLGLAAAGAHQHRRRPAAGSTGGQGRATTTNPEEREPLAY